MAYIIGGGPSIADVDLRRLEGRNVIALNSAFEDGDWPICYSQDECWFNDNYKTLRDFPGLKITCAPQLEVYSWMKVLRRGVRLGFSMNRSEISYGTNTGYGALNLAAKLGVKRIILFGYDMQRVGDRDNYHDRHSRAIPESVYEDDFIRAFKYCVEPLAGLGIEVLNATPGTALESFPVISVEEGLCGSPFAAYSVPEAIFA